MAAKKPTRHVTKPAATQPPPRGMLITNCNVTQPIDARANEHTARAVAAIADALTANANAARTLADTLRGTPLHITGLRITPPTEEPQDG